MNKVEYMKSIQAGARIATSPTKLESYYRECLSAAKYDMRENIKGLETVTTYINACIQRLKSDPSAFHELRQPPIFSLPNNMLAYINNNRINLIG